MRAQIVFSAIALAAILAAAAIAQGNVGPLAGLDFQLDALWADLLVARAGLATPV